MNIQTLMRPEDTLQEVLGRIFATGTITRADESSIFSVMTADAPLSSEMLDRVRDVLLRLQMGLLRIVD